MSLCRLLVMDFMERTGRFDDNCEELYSISDVKFGVAYARDLLDMGHTVEPWYKFDLEAFAFWCTEQLPRIRITREVAERTLRARWAQIERHNRDNAERYMKEGRTVAFTVTEIPGWCLMCATGEVIPTEVKRRRERKPIDELCCHNPFDHRNTLVIESNAFSSRLRCTVCQGCANISRKGAITPETCPCHAAPEAKGKACLTRT